MSFKRYSELIELPSFKERYEYLKLGGVVGNTTFSGHRYLNQRLYRSPEWKKIRDLVIIRDNGFDMACDGYPIVGKVLVHHMNPITIGDIVEGNPLVFDMENLICVSSDTHAIHYGDADLLQGDPIVRTKNDTCLWR